MKPIENKTTFGQQLAITFGVIVMVFVIIIAIIIFEANRLSSTTNLIKELHMPSTQVTQKLTTGIHHSLAALRAWMILNDEQFKSDRAKAWQQEIQPSLERMEQLSQNWKNPQNLQLLNQIKSHLFELSITQNRIEKIANTVEAQPARQILVEELTPMASSIASQITTMIDIEEQQIASSERKLLLKDMADFRGGFGLSLAAIRLFIITGSSHDRNEYVLYSTTSTTSFNLLSTKLSLLTPRQKIIFNQLQRDWYSFSLLPPRIISMRQNDSHNIANHLLSSKVEPQAQLILRLLKQLNTDQTIRLDDDFRLHHEEISELTQFIGISISAGILLVMALGVVITRSLRQLHQLEYNRKKVIDRTTKELKNANKNLTLQNEFGRQMEIISSSIQSHNKLDALCDGLIATLADFVNASFGVIYLNQRHIKTSTCDQQEQLVCYGRFAVASDMVNSPISIGAGLVGECAKSLKVLNYQNVPTGYLKANSGLGQSAPTHLLLVPIVLEKQIIGVIELASFTRFDEKQQQSISNITANIAIGINNQIYIDRVQALLEQTQQQSVVLTEKTHNLEEKNLEIEQSKQLLAERAKDLERSNRYKSDFLATMSHEIRTPMNGVLGMLGLLSESNLSKSQSKKVDMAQSSAKSLLSIINDILDFSKIDAGKLQLETLKFNLLEFLEDLCESFALKAHEKQLDLILNTIEVEHLWVVGDPIRIRQILTNLVGNAIKFTHTGRILVSISSEENSAGKVILRASIDDTGVGINIERHDMLFEPFKQADASTTRNFGGTGLGLSIVKRLVVDMGGEVKVVEKSSPGSRFEFTIELEACDGETFKQPDLTGQRILIINEDSGVREVVSKQLSNWRASVIEKSATQLLTQPMDPQKAFDLIIINQSDLEHDGVDIAAHIREIPEYNEVKLVALTDIHLSHRQFLDMEEAFDVLISKPIYVRDLVRCTDWCSNSNLLSESKPLEKKKHLPSDFPDDARVLLVEDNHINCEVAKAILENFYLSTDIANNGEEAIKVLKQAQSDKPYSIVLMDCQMPVMDGFTATKQIRAGEASDLYQDIPIVALTANAMEGDKEACLAAGMSDYLAKPVEPILLKKMLEKWL